MMMSSSDSELETLSIPPILHSSMTGKKTSDDKSPVTDLYASFCTKSLHGVVLLRGDLADFTTDHPAFLYDEGEARSLKIEKQLFEGQSDFQHVQVFQVGGSSALLCYGSLFSGRQFLHVVGSCIL
jgi:hypothetical protein